jgi:hypothetical protein
MLPGAINWRARIFLIPGIRLAKLRVSKIRPVPVHEWLSPVEDGLEVAS